MMNKTNTAHIVMLLFPSCFCSVKIVHITLLAYILAPMFSLLLQVSLRSTRVKLRNNKTIIMMELIFHTFYGYTHFVVSVEIGR
jgi:hypothetical protein